MRRQVHGHTPHPSHKQVVTRMPAVASFPVVERLKPQTSFHTPIAYYSVRMDRTPPQNEMFNLCLIAEDKSAYLRTFETYSNKHVFIAPTLPSISAILLAPMEYDWSMSYIDLEIQTPMDENNTRVTLQRFVCYEGTAHTQVMFVPEQEVNELAMMEANNRYASQKTQTNALSLMLLMGGTAFFQATAGLHSALVFAFGCTLGIMYQLLLQYEVDRMGKNQMFINSATRLGVLSVLVASMMSNANAIVPADIWIGSCGFLMQKVAMLMAFSNKN